MAGYPKRRLTPPEGRPPQMSARPPIRGGGLAAAPERGRVIAIMGAPMVGKTTLLRVAHEESETPSALIPSEEVSEEAVDRARRNGAEVVFLDGFPRTAAEAQWLYDRHYVTPFSGAVLRVERNVLPSREWSMGLIDLETRILDLSLPYAVVRNDDLEFGVLDVLSRAGVDR